MVKQIKIQLKIGGIVPLKRAAAVQDQLLRSCSSASDPELSDEEQLEFCVSAFRLYRGRFLPKNTEVLHCAPAAAL